MEIPINASLGDKGDGADVGPIPEGGGGGFGSRPDAAYRKALDDALSQVVGQTDFNIAYTTLTMSARLLMKLGMPATLMLEYQDKLAEIFAKRQEPAAPVQHIQQQNNIANNAAPLQGNIAKQDLRFGPNPDTDPKLL
jgi:hypothetical protein